MRLERDDHATRQAVRFQTSSRRAPKQKIFQLLQR
jgi:hypothetical protein